MTAVRFELPLPPLGDPVPSLTDPGPIIPARTGDERRKDEIVAALRDLQAAVLTLPAPVVEVAPVTAVPLDPYAISRAVGAALAPLLEDQSATTAGALEAVAKKLAALSKQVMAASMGGGGGGVSRAELADMTLTVGGTVSLSTPTLLTVAFTTANAGDNTVLAVAADKKLRLHWIACQADPDASATPILKVLIGAAEKYRAFGVVQHRDVLDGAAGDDLIVNVEDTTAVTVTAHYELLDA